MNELTDVFNNFKDKKGKFEEKLGKDVRGLMGVEIVQRFMMKNNRKTRKKNTQI